MVNTGGYAGITGLVILALDIWAIVSIIGSSASTGAKVLWTLLVIVLPLVGFIIWLLAGPRSSGRAG
ncbi:PLD nuclease N-terminal domain-containing protein [Pontibaca methylaminivorans]|uniref:Phospholipase_D-nuclease N-terminal n=1 Tax=Pontibaca methylaminivorans TaxID=515897 RepID=A0A1R3WQM1_9RHOB|nr:PLD nuclease N-terminal domain-containing protein [Pontibaca methylaminivorans]SIT80210.1 Phospholipase_D-nuclease N-terminal [Pontibaca methylaminivorans]